MHGNETYLCPLSVDWQVPVDASHTLMVWSLLALAILPPQGEKDTDLTSRLLKNTKLVLNTKLQEKAFYARKWDVPVPPQGRPNGRPCCCVPQSYRVVSVISFAAA